MSKKFLLVAIFLIAISPTFAQPVKIPLTIAQWDTLRTEFITETYLGKECILLKSGFISAKGVDLRDGIIEADISFPQERAFPGFAFRIQDLDNFENFYVRPHQSGNPDATQYTPVCKGQAGWQLYHGEGYSNSYKFKFDQWHHIKIAMHGLQAEIYIDDMNTPLIKVRELLNGWKGGTFGLMAGGTTLRVANVQYTAQQGTPPAVIPVPANGTGGLITQCQVSNVVSRDLFSKKPELTSGIKKQLTWTTQRSESSGVINLSRFCQLTEKANTAVVKVMLESGSAQVKELHFGFSDFVTVYLNDKAIFSGADNFMSRDYRFLGTIGYFDILPLQLKKGMNELWFVVSENFGGWGIKARLDNMENIRLK